MTNKEIKETCKMLPNFIKVCENELGEAQHKNAKPISIEDYNNIEKLILKLNNLQNYVNTNIFGSGSNGL